MASGVAVSDSCIDLMNEVNLGDKKGKGAAKGGSSSAKKKYLFVGFRISDDLKEVVVDENYCVGADKVDHCDCEEDKENERYNIFKSMIKSSEPRWFIYDCGKGFSDGRFKEQLVGIHWVPDNAPIKQKMLYAASKETVKTKLKAVTTFIEAADLDDLDHKRILENVK